MKNFVQNGNTIAVIATEDMVSGMPYLVGDLRGVAAHSALTGESCELVTEGVFNLAKTSANVIAQGDKVYLIAAGGEVSSTAPANFLFGIATEAAGNGDIVIPVRLIQSASAAGAVS